MSNAVATSGREPPGPSRARVWQMFDRIARRYDLINSVLSLGIDRRWRRRVVRCFDRPTPILVDLATGTGEQLLSLCRELKGVKKAMGVDLSTEMMTAALPKLQGLPAQLIRGDATRLPLKDSFADAVTISFGIRNVPDTKAGISEMYRILNRDGKCVILEFGIPRNLLIRLGYLLYFRYVLPFLGGLISGDHGAYRYLNRTVESFPQGDDFAGLMREAGFREVRYQSLSFGIAYIYEGQK